MKDRREYQRQYREANKERLKGVAKIWYERNRSRMLLYKKLWYVNNKIEILTKLKTKRNAQNNTSNRIDGNDSPVGNR